MPHAVRWIGESPSGIAPRLSLYSEVSWPNFLGAVHVTVLQLLLLPIVLDISMLSYHALTGSVL